VTNGHDLGRKSYAVIWRSGDGPVRPGKLVLGPTSFHLETGKPGGRLSAQRIRYADLASVDKAVPAERLHGRPTTVVRRTEREPLAISAVDGLGSAHEIVERLARALPSRGAA
jgi:hypothetical protein